MTAAELEQCTVLDYLALCQERRLEEATRYLAPTAILEFPGGERYETLNEMAHAAQRRYRTVRKRIDCAWSGTDGPNRRVAVSGRLEGVSASGEPFVGVRFVDLFLLRDGIIHEQQVFNDL